MEKRLNNSEKRNAILSALKNTTTHPSADWIFEKVREDCPGIGIATVYRNLKILLEQNQIFKVDVGDGLDHYDAQTEIPHDHTYCTSCGCIGDIEAISASGLEQFAKDEFSVEAYSLVLYGKCKKCKQEETLETKVI
ncbi:MAG: transcriptional repressor [Clostridia bacterium]|nr:transcriptional repressor [Clostridia bacterium]